MTTSTEELSIEGLLTNLKKEMKLIRSEESKLKKDVILLNEQFCNLVIQASERYPEILNEDFAKRSARYTRKPKPTHAMHSSQILGVDSNGQHCVQYIETDMKRSPSLPIVNGVRDKAKLLMCQHSPDMASDNLVPRIKTERTNRNGVCRSSAFRLSLQEIRESNNKLLSRSEGESMNFQLDKNEKDFTENEEGKKESASKLEHLSSTTESSDGSATSMISQNHCSPDTMDEKRKKKLKRRLLDARKSRDVVNLGMF